MTPTKLSHALSWVLHPFLLPLYLVTFLLTMTSFSLYPPEVKRYVVWVVVLYTLLLPALALLVLRRVGRLSSYRIDNRRERLIPLLIGTICYLLCALTFAKLPTIIFLRKFMVAAACCEVMCLMVSLRWKISLHLTGMGALVAMLTVMNIVGVRNLFLPLLVAIALAGVLASARLYLGCHNAWQILAGFGGGFCIALLAVLFL